MRGGGRGHGAAGPPALAAAVRERLARPAPLVAGWLAGARPTPVDDYLARAASAPVLEALGRAGGRRVLPGARRRRCPRCGGPPQLSYVADAGESLVSGPRSCCARAASLDVLAQLLSGVRRGRARLAVYAEHWHGPVCRSSPTTSSGVRAPSRRRLLDVRRYLIDGRHARATRARCPSSTSWRRCPSTSTRRSGARRRSTPNLMGSG